MSKITKSFNALYSIMIPHFVPSEEKGSKRVVYVGKENLIRKDYVEISSNMSTKEKLTRFLKCIPEKFISTEVLVLGVYFFRRHNNGNNIAQFLSLIREAGSGVIWRTEHQFTSIFCHRVIEPSMSAEEVRTIIYVTEVPPKHFGKLSYLNGRHAHIAEHFRRNYAVKESRGTSHVKGRFYCEMCEELGWNK